MAGKTLEKTIGFIGAGQMARALATGLVQAGTVREDRLLAADPDEDARNQLRAAVPQVHVGRGNAEVVQQADVVIIAVKPQQMATVLDELADVSKADKLFVSIAAGITLTVLAEGLGTQRLIRVMPNTPCLVGRGAAGYCLAPGATLEDGQLVAGLLNAVGISREVPEKLIDAVTGLSGSGPAFVYLMIEALADGGVLMGLPRETAAMLATHTVWGAAELVATSGDHPAVLKDRVTSPGGTTIAGLQALENGGLSATLMAAVEAATRRSQQLGNS